MSGNQKQAPPVAPQPQTRFNTPTNYRPPTPQRTDGSFHVGPQQFVQQQPPNQAGNQGPGLRGMAPTGPPTQASTPPNADLKVTHMAQQQSVNMAYVPRGNQNYYGRPPQSQTQRMVNPRQGQQPIYQQQQQAGTSLVMPQFPMVLNVPYAFNSGQRPTYMPQNYQIYPGNQLAATYSTYPPPHPYYYNMQRATPQPQPPVQAVPQSMPHAPTQNVPMAQAPQQNPLSKTKTKRVNAIPIINPDTGKEINNDEDDFSHPASGESSARQTPQPAPHNVSREAVQANFAKQVAQVLRNEAPEELEHGAAVLNEHHTEIPPPHSTYHPTTQVVHNSRNDLVQSSKLQVPTKDFVPANQSVTAKETPVVSAISNAVEVTITNKQSKDKDSPAKGRKQREQHREAPKEIVKEVIPPPVEKPVKDEKPKEPLPTTETTVIIAKELKDKELSRDEKKPPKKVESNKGNTSSFPVSQEVAPETIAVPPVTPAVIPPPVDNAKLKQSSQRGKESSKPQQQQAPPVVAIPSKQPPSPPAIVPQSQPAKANNKSNKMKELNMKGAIKEGTDMDAFNDNLELANTTTTNTAIVSNESNDKVTAAPTIPINPKINDTNKKIDAIETPTIKTEIKRLKGKIDITDIVKDVPKPFVAPPQPKDETDRAVVANDKLVQAKNEVNAKIAAESDDGSDSKSSLPYKENQWSPYNKDGKKVYDKDFLLALRNYPKSKQKPDNILTEVIANDDKSRVGDVSRYAMGGRTDFAPAFGGCNFAGKTQSQRGVAKRGSQQGKIGGNPKGGKSNSVIKVSISFKEDDVKLNVTENAWKPARLGADCITDEDKKTAELYRKVRGILNKLTPQKFKTLVNQIKSLTIDTVNRLQGVIDLVFEKAVDEPNFSVAYADMCKELISIQVPVSAGSKEVNFRKLLLTRCQMEFEKNEEASHNEKLKLIEECADPEKKKVLLAALAEDERRLRMKSVGNIRFIGELFKQGMLTVNIMLRCLQVLIGSRDEESLECLCKLLSTIGKNLEENNIDLQGIINQMREIAQDSKSSKVTSRVRFMLQDVIDLRSNKWVPRRQDLNPKTIDQIQKEAENEQLTIQALNSGPMTPRKDDNRGPPQNSDRKRGGRNVTDDGWSTAPIRSKNTTFSVQSDKLKIKQPLGDEPLGSSEMFGNWTRGSNVKTSATNNTNKYAALDMDIDNKTMNRSNKRDTYNSKGSSMERGYNKQYDGRGSRSGSQHRQSDNLPRRTITAQPPANIRPQRMPVVEPVVNRLTPEQLERKIKNIVDEYVNDCSSLTDTVDDIKNSIDSSSFEQLITDAYNSVVERSKTARVKTSGLIAHLISANIIPMNTYCTALENVFAIAEDLLVDIPNIWDCYAELLSEPINKSVLPLAMLHKACHQIIASGHGSKIVTAVFKIVLEDKGPNLLLSIWKASNLTLEDFMPADTVDKFITQNHFEFLKGSSGSGAYPQSNLTYSQVYDKLIQFIQGKTVNDDINKWIQANLGDRVTDKKFIRVLATAFIETSINQNKLDVDNLRNICHPMLLLYINNKPEFELQCLYAIQSIVNKLDHPRGLLLELFNNLYEDGIIPHDIFIAWQDSEDPAEQEKKGVAAKQLTSFFTQLGEESASSCSEEA